MEQVRVEQTVFDVLEDGLGTPFGPELIETVELAPYERLRDLQAHVKAFGKTADVPDKQPAQLRPYVPLERHEFARVEHELYLRPHDFADPHKASAALNALKHHLLYCHSLAIDNPLRDLLDPFSLAADLSPDGYLSRTGYLARQRAMLVNYLRFLEQIKPLVRAQVIVWVEHDVTVPFLQDGALPDIAPVAQTADFSDMPAEDQAVLEARGELARHAFASHANDQLAIGLQEVARHSGALDLYLPYRHFESVLRAVAARTPADVPEWPREGELQVLNDLLKVPLPRLAELTPADIVKIREGEQAFAQWRVSLEHGLERLGALDPETLGHNNEELRILEQELLGGRQALEAEIAKSGFLSQAKRGIKEFSIGGVVALGLTPVAGPLPALATGSGQFGLRLLVDLLFGRGKRKHAQALYRQYLLFSPSTSADSRAR